MACGCEPTPIRRLCLCCFVFRKLRYREHEGGREHAARRLKAVHIAEQGIEKKITGINKAWVLTEACRAELERPHQRKMIGNARNGFQGADFIIGAESSEQVVRD